jgi:hypothetical protein
MLLNLIPRFQALWLLSGAVVANKHINVIKFDTKVSSPMVIERCSGSK